MISEPTPGRELLEPLSLPGGRALPSRILPGPMEGIMTRDFCRVMMDFDLVPAWITPFIRILDEVPRRGILAKRIQQFQPVPMVVQIMGTNRSSLVRAAKTLMTFENVQGIELNCACPSSRVLRSGAGSALLKDPEWIRDTLFALRDVVPDGGIGVKVRSGLDAPDELSGIVSAIRDANPDWLVLHYRTAREMYQPISEGWNRFATAKEILGTIPLLASGDLLSVDACLNLVKSFNIDGMTPARGLLKNPWLIRDVEAAFRGDRPMEKHVGPFLARLIEYGLEKTNWRPGNVLDIAKMAWGEESSLFQQLATNHDPREMLAVLEKM